MSTSSMDPREMGFSYGVFCWETLPFSQFLAFPTAQSRIWSPNGTARERSALPSWLAGPLSTSQNPSRTRKCSSSLRLKYLATSGF